MRKIKELAQGIKEEIRDSEKYSKFAMQYKETDKRTADMYHELAKQEIHHAEMEHEQVVRLIREQQDAGKEVPAGMLEVWEWEHEQIIEDEAAAKILLEMYEK